MPAILKKYHDRENGFTLIELLIVVLIIGVLAAIAIPVYLGIQTQSAKSAIKSDVNIEVKRVQVALTEGSTITAVKANQAAYEQTSVSGEMPKIAKSTTTGATSDDFMVSNYVSTTGTPAGSFNYSYTYDSVTGQFTESGSGLAFGSATPTLTITTGSIANAIVGQTYSQTINAATTNPQGTTSWTITGLAGSGLSFNTSTGVISGTPTTTGTYPITVTATNGPANDTHSYNLNVYSLPTITTASLPNATVNSSYSQQLSTTGVPAVTSYTVASGALPTGITLNTSTGLISGTPTVTGSYSFSITATNTAGSSTPPTAYTIIVGGAPSISTTSLPWAYTNAPYSVTYAAYNQNVAATAYPSPTYAVASGTLPTGLNLNTATGAISGTPTVNGTSNFTISATNTFGTATQPYTFKTGTYIVGCDDGAELQASQGCASYGTYYNPSSTYTTAQAYNQSWSWKITTTNQGYVQGIIACPGNQSYNLPAGTQIQAGLWVEGTAGSTWAVGGRTSYDEADGQNGITLNGVGSANWQHATANYTLTQASTSACIQVRQNYNTVGWDLYGDNLSIAYAKP